VLATRRQLGYSYRLTVVKRSDHCYGWGAKFRRQRDLADSNTVTYMTEGRTSSGELTLLVSCVGRRVELLQAFRAAARRLGVKLCLIGSDTDATAPALACVDIPILTPPISNNGYVPALLEIVRQHRVDALIPTIDTDLPVLSEHRADFEKAGCQALIAEPGVIDICRDKILTFQFLERGGFDTPTTFSEKEIWSLDDLDNCEYPLFVKPRFGSASQWVHKIEDRIDLEYYLRKIDEPIVQEYVEGLEHTLDVYVGLTGEPRCVVPRARWQVRGGEVSKGVVIKDRKVMEAGKRVVEALGPSLRGLVTIQCIVTSDHRIRFIEINPRFGGGAPLGIAAGADYPAWLMQALLGREPKIAFDGFQNGLCMLRYDWSAFLPLDDNLTPRVLPPLKEYPDW